MAGSDGDIQISPESTGPRVKTILLEVRLTDDTVGNVEMQVVGIADKYGTVHDDFSSQEMQARILEELQRIRHGIEMVIGESLEDNRDGIGLYPESKNA